MKSELAFVETWSAISMNVRLVCLLAGILSVSSAFAFDGGSQSPNILLNLSATAGQSSPPKNAVDVKERLLAEQGVASLHVAWSKYFKNLAKRQAAKPPKTFSPQALLAPEVQKQIEANLPAPQRRSLAQAATEEFLEPEVLRSENGELRVTLDMAYANNRIGKDPVHLRAYNGKLVGPTLRLKPGDTLYMTLNNTMSGERWQPNMMNTINSFNTTNMHFHGLHVSPNGNSDNVLIEVGPKETQYYEVHIPKDHTPGTYWYHPHRHGSTAGDVASGLSGTLIIEGGLDNIPEIKAAKERVMVLNQIPYIYKNTLPDPQTGKPVTFDLKAGEVEAKYAGFIFGPGDWDQLGRYTTINGVQLPVIAMRPGEVERWRLVDSGQRETIHLRLVPAPSPSQIARSPIALNEIAVDGLALGKLESSQMVELWPGYRSDVLVKAPPIPGEYLLINDAAPAEESMNGKSEPLNYVARVVIKGTPNPMRLPRNEQMAGLRLPSIKNSSITGHQVARYGIVDAGNGVAFTIDGKSFTMETARELKLNDVDEWTLVSANSQDIGFVTHPFHIHVNPFEVTSIMTPVIKNGKPVLRHGKPVYAEQLRHGPVWRDTVKIPGGGYVKMRTHYTTFIGTFVQHCHILDHEDQGMMELIDIVDPKTPASKTALSVPKLNSIAPSCELPDANGKLHSLLAQTGKPAVLFFFKGHGCLHCSLQVAAFTAHYQEFARKGVQVIGVTSDSPTELRTALTKYPCPFPILADPSGSAFAKFGCVGTSGLEHGTFVLGANHHVIWRTIGSSPFLIVTDLLKTLQPVASTIRRSASHI